MKLSKHTFSGSVRLLMLLGLLIVAAPLVANAQTKDLSNDSAPSAGEITNQSDVVTAIDPGDGFQPFQTMVVFNQQPGFNSSQVDILTVPTGKRLVIEFVTVNTQLPSGQRAVSFQLVPGGGAAFFLLVNEQPAAVNGDAIFRAAQSLRLYANPGTLVRINLGRSSSLGIGQYQVAVSGYLEDAN
jgi:hypothetical protein